MPHVLSGLSTKNCFRITGSTGTTAAAMVIRDLVKDRKFDNCRDTARVLISVPFHIRRPNRQLVEEFAQLGSADLKCEFAERAWPVVMGHLVRMTCAGLMFTNRGTEQTKKHALTLLVPNGFRNYFKCTNQLVGTDKRRFPRCPVSTTLPSAEPQKY